MKLQLEADTSVAYSYCSSQTATEKCHLVTAEKEAILRDDCLSILAYQKKHWYDHSRTEAHYSDDLHSNTIYY